MNTTAGVNGSVVFARAPASPWSLERLGDVTDIAIDSCVVHVVDDVYSDPNCVRSFALTTPFWSEGRGRYPGRFLFSPVPTRFYCSMLSEVLGREVVPSKNYRFAPFAMIEYSAGMSSTQSAVPHSDGFCDYVAIIYLSERSDASSDEPTGTSFWRHMRTGLSGAPGHWSSDDTRASLDEPVESAWQRIACVDLCYNRMVVFPANLFHRIELGDLKAPGSLRLTQNLYVTRRG